MKTFPFGALLALSTACLASACAGPRWKPTAPSGAHYAYTSTGATLSYASRSSKTSGGVRTTEYEAGTRTSSTASGRWQDESTNAPTYGDRYNAHLGTAGEKVTP